LYVDIPIEPSRRRVPREAKEDAEEDRTYNLEELHDQAVIIQPINYQLLNAEILNNKMEM